MSVPDYVSNHEVYRQNIELSKKWHRQRRLEQHSKNPNVVYVLECAEDTIYIGSTWNFDMRYKAHKDGATDFTRRFPPVRVIELIEVEYNNRLKLESSTLTKWRLAYPHKIIGGASGKGCSVKALIARQKLNQN